MASGVITQPVDVDDLYWKPGDSFAIGINQAQWPAVCSSARSIWWTIPLCKPVRADVASVSVSGGLAVRASGKGQTNLTSVTANTVTITDCGLLCNYTADSDVVNSAVETVNVSPRGTRITVTFS